MIFVIIFPLHRFSSMLMSTLSHFMYEMLIPLSWCVPFYYFLYHQQGIFQIYFLFFNGYIIHHSLLVFDLCLYQSYFSLMLDFIYHILSISPSSIILTCTYGWEKYILCFSLRSWRSEMTSYLSFFSYLCVWYITHLTYINHMYFYMCKIVCQMGQVMFVWCHCTNETSLFMSCLTWIFIPGLHANRSHWITADMTNTRQHMPSHDWPVISYIKQSTLLLWEKASVSATTLVERVRYFLVESGYLYKSLGTFKM